MRILFVTVIFLFACGKDQPDPVFNNFPLTGSWVSTDGRLIFNIKNLKNEGTDETYYEYKENGRRYIRRVMYGLPYRWEIVRLTPNDMTLLDEMGNAVNFWRVT